MRLTEKNETGFVKDISYFPSDELENKSEIEISKLLLNKLGQLEDIEDELGIDLITLFKALKNGIYVKTKCGISKQYTIHLMRWQQTSTYCLYYRPYSHIWFKDYGITWALTKEELKDE